MVVKLKMRYRLNEALRLAEEANPEAKLVRIIGLGVHDDGSVHLGMLKDPVSRWEYAFMDDKGGEAPPQYVTVLYWGTGEKPLVDKNAGNVGNTEMFDDEIIPKLKDSGVLIELFNRQSDYKRMGGHNNDVILYQMEKMLAPVAIMQNWKNQFLRVDPVTLEIF